MLDCLFTLSTWRVKYSWKNANFWSQCLDVGKKQLVGILLKKIFSNPIVKNDNAFSSKKKRLEKHVHSLIQTISLLMASKYLLFKILLLVVEVSHQMMTYTTFFQKIFDQRTIFEPGIFSKYLRANRCHGLVHFVRSFVFKKLFTIRLQIKYYTT